MLIVRTWKRDRSRNVMSLQAAIGCLVQFYGASRDKERIRTVSLDVERRLRNGETIETEHASYCCIGSQANLGRSQVSRPSGCLDG